MTDQPSQREAKRRRIMLDERIAKSSVKSLTSRHLRESWGQLLAQGKLWLGCLAVSGLTMLFPGLATTPLDEYLQKHDLPEDTLKTLRNTSVGPEEIRVMDRYNPLTVFYTGGATLRAHYADSMRDDSKIDGISDVLATGWSYVGAYFAGIYGGVVGLLPPYTPFDAHAIRATRPDASSQFCDIRPPGPVGLAEMIDDFAELKGVKTKQIADQAQIETALQAIAMHHEIRHCYQAQSELVTAMQEADADLHALSVLEQAPQTEAVAAQVSDLVQHSRMTASFFQASKSHATSAMIAQGPSSHFDSLTTQAAEAGLRVMVRPVAEMIDSYAPKGMTKAELNYHVIKMMKAQDVFQESPAIAAAADRYLEAITYFDELFDHSVITDPAFDTSFDLTMAAKRYRPGRAAIVKLKP